MRVVETIVATLGFAPPLTRPERKLLCFMDRLRTVRDELLLAHGLEPQEAVRHLLLAMSFSADDRRTLVRLIHEFKRSNCHRRVEMVKELETLCSHFNRWDRVAVFVWVSEWRTEVEGRKKETSRTSLEVQAREMVETNFDAVAPAIEGLERLVGELEF